MTIQIYMYISKFNYEISTIANEITKFQEQ